MNEKQSHDLVEPPAVDDSDHEHKSHMGIFILVFVMLLALTGLSFWIANSHLMENRTVGWTAMMAVSVAKAMLVITFFMHLWWEKKWKYILTFPALIMGSLLVMLLVPDVGARQDTYTETRRSMAPTAREHSARSGHGDHVQSHEDSRHE